MEANEDKAVREKMIRYRKFVEDREKKLAELQTKFEEVVPKLIDTPGFEDDIPEIRESMDGEINNGHLKHSKIGKGILPILGVALLLALPFVKFGFDIRSDGEVVPESRTVFRAPFDGFLDKLNFKEGDNIEKGQEIGELRNRDLNFDLAKSKEEKLSLQNQQSILEDYINEFGKVIKPLKAMGRENQVAFLDYEKVIGRYYDINLQKEAIRQKLAKIETTIRQLEEQKIQARLIAPFAGKIVTSDLQSKKGAFFEKGDKLFELIDPGQFYIQATVPEERIKDLKMGLRTKVSIKGIKKPIKGRIVEIGNYSGKPQVTLKELISEKEEAHKGVIVMISTINKLKGVKYGESARVKIMVDKKSLAEIVKGQ